MSWAEIILFDEVRVRQQWDTLCQQLQTRFDQWRDRDDYPTCRPRRTVSPAYLLSHM
jgi:hypothetical protein